MPYLDTKYGRKNFSYSSLSEFRRAIEEREEAIFPKRTFNLFGEIITEIDVKSITEGTCAFGSEFQTLEAVIKMLEGYENSDSDHSVVDFYNQNYIQNKVLPSKALGEMLGCHASQAQYRALEAKLGLQVECYKKLLEQYKNRSHPLLIKIENEIRNTLIIRMASTITDARNQIIHATALNNTAIATGICNMLLLEGKEGYAKLHDFHDQVRTQLDETKEEIDEMFEQLNEYFSAKHIEDIEVSDNDEE